MTTNDPDIPQYPVPEGPTGQPPAPPHHVPSAHGVPSAPGGPSAPSGPPTWQDVAAAGGPQAWLQRNSTGQYPGSQPMGGATAVGAVFGLGLLVMGLGLMVWRTSVDDFNEAVLWIGWFLMISGSMTTLAAAIGWGIRLGRLP